MATRLPRGDQAVIDIRKLEDYCLDAFHPKGRHKALVFQNVLGLTRDDAFLLRDILLHAAANEEATLMNTDV